MKNRLIDLNKIIWKHNKLYKTQHYITFLNRHRYFENKLLNLNINNSNSIIHSSAYIADILTNKYTNNINNKKNIKKTN